MKRHPEFGSDIIGAKKNIADLSRKVVIQHHERFNGSGYPFHLVGPVIHEIGLMSAVADVYDALTSDRVYKSAWTPQQALAHIFQGCDADYSRKIVELFTKHLGIYPVGSFVRLKSGEMGIVTKVERGNILAPKVLILFDGLGNRLDDPLDYDLLLKQAAPGGELYRVDVSLNPRAYGIEIKNYL
jgi:HD-GYP domain-containing protein (c-di-GMP phosphodiesterase class II)